MKDRQQYYTPRWIVNSIFRITTEYEYCKLKSNFPTLQVFPPPESEDAVLRSISNLERMIIDFEKQPIGQQRSPLTHRFTVSLLERILLYDVFHFVFEGNIKPLIRYRQSVLITQSPLIDLLVDDYLQGKIIKKRGAKLHKDRWKYKFSKLWLIEIDGFQKVDATLRAIEIFFGKERSTVIWRVGQLTGTDDEKCMQEIISIAKQYPEMREQYLDAYCKEFKELFGPC